MCISIYVKESVGFPSDFHPHKWCADWPNPHKDSISKNKIDKHKFFTLKTVLLFSKLGRYIR